MSKLRSGGVSDQGFGTVFDSRYGLKHQRSSAPPQCISRVWPFPQQKSHDAYFQVKSADTCSFHSLEVTGDRTGTEHQCVAPSPSSSSLFTQARVHAQLKHTYSVQQTERGVFITVVVQGRWRPVVHMMKHWGSVCVSVCLQRRLTFSDFRRAQFQVVPRPAVQVEVRGRDPPLLLRRANEPPTCGATQRGWKQTLTDAAWRAKSSQLGARGVSVFGETQPMNSERR